MATDPVCGMTSIDGRLIRWTRPPRQSIVVALAWPLMKMAMTASNLRGKSQAFCATPNSTRFTPKAGGKRISGAGIKAKVSEFGLPGQERKLDPMAIASTVSYGSYFAMTNPGYIGLISKSDTPGNILSGRLRPSSNTGARKIERMPMSNDRRIDPVCGMEVPAHQNETVYLSIHYAFCSQQCLDRFTAHPHLYVGLPGRKAPKQEGREIPKRRRLRLASALSPDQALLLSGALAPMMGLKKVSVEGDKVEITYDLMLVTAEQIEAKIAETCLCLGNGWPERVRHAFVHYQEECEAGNMEVQERHVLGSGR